MDSDYFGEEESSFLCGDTEADYLTFCLIIGRKAR